MSLGSAAACCAMLSLHAFFTLSIPRTRADPNDRAHLLAALPNAFLSDASAKQT